MQSISVHRTTEVDTSYFFVCEEIQMEIHVENLRRLLLKDDGGSV